MRFRHPTWTIPLCSSPYLSADMRLMASFFNTTLAGLEEELMNLILDGQIQARIDSHKKVGRNCLEVCLGRSKKVADTIVPWSRHRYKPPRQKWELYRTVP